MKKLYTPEQKKEKQRERSRNYQKKRTMQKRIVRYSCFLINNDYTVLRNEEYEKMTKRINLLSKSVWILSISWILLFIWFIIK